MATGDEEDDPSDGRRWVLSFRVHHPSADLAALAERIGEAFGADRRVLWREGELDSRARPPRPRSSSYCSVRWPNRGGSFEHALEDALAALAPLQAELAELCATGGRFDFFAGLFFLRTMGVALPPALLARLGAAGVELQLDLYGGGAGA
jgi:hypothetical protein